jgi:hypothetical protein
VTNEQRKTYITGLIEERRGYANRGLDDKVAEVDAELRRMGHEASVPQERAERRPAARKRKAETR